MRCLLFCITFAYFVALRFVWNLAIDWCCYLLVCVSCSFDLFDFVWGLIVFLLAINQLCVFVSLIFLVVMIWWFVEIVVLVACLPNVGGLFTYGFVSIVLHFSCLC